MADDDQEQPGPGNRRRKAPKSPEPAEDAAAQPPGPPAGSAGDPGPDEDAPGELPITSSDRVTGSAASGSPGEVSGRALRKLLAEMPPEKRNKLVPGTLTVHYASRDVQFPMDGESAMRMLAVLAGTSNDMDEIDRTSDALRLWMMIDRHDVLGAQWTPGDATVPRRATMDPGGLVDAS